MGTQTTLEVTALEEDNQKRIAELAEVHVAKGYPSQEDFKGSEKVLRFYTGISSFTVLMALFLLLFLMEEQRSSVNLTILYSH